MTSKTEPTPSRASMIKEAIRSVGPRASTPDEMPPAVAGRRKYRGPKGRTLAPLDSISRLPLFEERRAVVRWFPQTRDRDVTSDPTMLGATFDYAAALPAVPVVETRGRPVARGWRAVLERLEGQGFRVLMTRDRTRVALLTPGGRGINDLGYAFERAAGLLVAGLRGEPMACSWCTDEAETILFGGAGWCTRCDPAAEPDQAS